MNSTCVNIACWYHWCFTPQIAGYAGFAPMVRGQILFIPPADLSSAIQMPKIWRDTTRVTSRSRRPTCSLNGHAFYLVNGINGGYPNSWMVYTVENPSIKRWFGGTPMLGDLHMIHLCECGHSINIRYKIMKHNITGSSNSFKLLLGCTPHVHKHTIYPITRVSQCCHRCCKSSDPLTQFDCLTKDQHSNSLLDP